MNQAPDNPAGNQLRAGVTDGQVESAIRSSGYPLQITVSSLLTPSFHVLEEWAYSDRTTGDMRTIDIVAESELNEGDDPNKYRIRPRLDLIIECKQSDLPYIFFLTRDVQQVPRIPILAGLRSDEIVITTDDDRSTWTLSVLLALELAFHPFVTGPPMCSTFSRCIRKSDGLILSGSDIYNQLVMPLMSAMHHFRASAYPSATAYYFEAHLVLGIAVLDAPMIGVEVTKDSNNLSFMPWVRILRHEPGERKGRAHVGDLYAIDIVHKDFFMSYLKSHVIPFAEQFEALAQRHHEEIATGKAFVSGMGEDSFRSLNVRMQPRTVSKPPPLRIPPKKKRKK